MNEMKTLTMGGKTYDSFIDKTARADVDALTNRVDSLPTGGGFDYTKCGLPVLYLNGNASDMTKEKNEVELEYKLVTRKAPYYNGGVIASGTCQCKWQGSSSVRNEYAKHNYTIKFDAAFEATAAVSKRSGDPADDKESEFGSKRERKWGAQNKYCLKANWIDPSSIRNVVNAKLWGDIVRSRATSKYVSPAPTQLSTAPNGGAIDGFPCIIAINGEFEGLYTFNIPKEGWLFGMGESLTEYVVSGEENGKAACGFYSTPTFVEDANEKVDFSVEYKHKDVAEETVVASFKTAVNTVKDCSNSAAWETEVADVFDVDSAIDYYIFICCISAHDNLRRNTLYATYDGGKWFMSAYDLDTTFGSNPYGTGLFEVKTARTQFREAALTADAKHRLFGLIYQHSFDKLRSRYWELRNSVLSNENVWYMLTNFANRIPRAIYNLDAEKFADKPDYDKYPMPATTTANVENYMQYYQMHCALLDKEMALNEDEPDVPDDPVIPDGPVELVDYPVQDGLQGLYDLGGTPEATLVNHAQNPTYTPTAASKLEGSYEMDDNYVAFSGATNTSRMPTYLRLPQSDGLTYIVLFRVASGARVLLGNRSGASTAAGNGVSLRNDGVEFGKSGTYTTPSFKVGDTPVSINSTDKFAILAMTTTANELRVARYTSGALNAPLYHFEGDIDTWTSGSSGNAICIGGYGKSSNAYADADIALTAIHTGVLNDKQLESVCKFVYDYGTQKGLTIE